MNTGKATFLKDEHKIHNCTYIRQYHNLQPYVAVSAIPNYDTTRVSMNDSSYDHKQETYSNNLLSQYLTTVRALHFFAASVLGHIHFGEEGQIHHHGWQDSRHGHGGSLGRTAQNIAL